MPQFQPGDIVEYTFYDGSIRTRQVSHMENNGRRVRFTNGSWMGANECRFKCTTRPVTKNLTGFAQWHKEKIDASV